jgi:hypothetical protein
MAIKAIVGQGFRDNSSKSHPQKVSTAGTWNCGKARLPNLLFSDVHWPAREGSLKRPHTHESPVGIIQVFHYKRGKQKLDGKFSREFNVPGIQA